MKRLLLIAAFVLTAHSAARAQASFEYYWPWIRSHINSNDIISSNSVTTLQLLPSSTTGYVERISSHVYGVSFPSGGGYINTNAILATLPTNYWNQSAVNASTWTNWAKTWTNGVLTNGVAILGNTNATTVSNHMLYVWFNTNVGTSASGGDVWKGSNQVFTGINGFSNSVDFYPESAPAANTSAMRMYSLATATGNTANAVLLLNCNGTNLSTWFPDASGRHDMTAYGDAKVSTSNPKYGTGAILLDGVGDVVYSTNSPDYDFGTGDFTVEFWWYPTASHVGYNGLLTCMTRVDGLHDTGWAILYDNANHIEWYSYNGVGKTFGTIAQNVYTHCAMVRSGNNLICYTNGVASGTPLDVTGVTINGSGDLMIGRLYNNFDGYYVEGNMDDVRITKGTAVYTGNFTPPAAELAYSTNSTYAYTLWAVGPDGTRYQIVPDTNATAEATLPPNWASVSNAATFGSNTSVTVSNLLTGLQSSYNTTSNKVDAIAGSVSGISNHVDSLQLSFNATSNTSVWASNTANYATNWISTNGLQGQITTLNTGTNGFVRTNDTRVGINIPAEMTLGNTKIWSTNTQLVGNHDSRYGLNPASINLNGSADVDKWVVWGDTNGTNFAAGTFRSEAGQYWYLYNKQAETIPITVSRSGRIGFNHEPNIIDYHSLWSGAGVDDASFGGVTTAKQTYRYMVYIVSTGATDTWSWKMSADYGSTWFAQAPYTNNCATTNMAMTNGVTIAFDSPSGHSLADTWMKVGWSQLPVASTEIRPRRFQEALTLTNWWVGGTSTNVDLTYRFGTGYTNTDVLATTNDCILLGAKSPINSIFINVVSPGAGLTLICEYWNGSSWITMTQSANTYIDGTTNLTTYGTIQYEMSTTAQVQFAMPNEDPAEYTLYWLRLRTTTTPTATPTVNVITPHGLYRLAVYRGQLTATPDMYVGGRGNTYVQRGYRMDTGAYEPTEFVTEARAEALVKSALGTYYYPQTNFASVGSFTSLLTRAMILLPAATAFAFTNAVAANSVNTGSVFVATNTTFVTSKIAAGTKFTVNQNVNSYGNAGYGSTERFQLIEWNAGLTNVLGTSGDSLALPSAAGSFVDVNLTFTVPSDITVSITNYLGYRPLLVTTGNKAGTWIRNYGGQYNANFISGNGVAGSTGQTNIDITPFVQTNDTRAVTLNGLTHGSNWWVNAGNFGIGTNDPSTTFYVKTPSGKSAPILDRTISDAGSGFAGGLALRYSSTNQLPQPGDGMGLTFQAVNSSNTYKTYGSFEIGFSNTTYGTEEGYGTVWLEHAGVEHAEYLNVLATDVGGNAVQLTGSTGKELGLGASRSETMRMKLNGNVGIGGVTNPVNRLVVSGAKNNPALRLRPLSTDTMSAEDWVGISFATGNIIESTTNRSAEIRGYGDQYNDQVGLDFFTSNGSAPTRKMRLNNLGYLGINTTNIATTLDVNGASTFRGTMALTGNSITNVALLSASNVTVTGSGTLTLGGEGRTNWWKQYMGSVGSGSGATDFRLNISSGVTNDGAWHTAMITNVALQSCSNLFGIFYFKGTAANVEVDFQSGSYADGAMPCFAEFTQVIETWRQGTFYIAHGGATNVRIRIPSTINSLGYTIVGGTK